MQTEIYSIQPNFFLSILKKHVSAGAIYPRPSISRRFVRKKSADSNSVSPSPHPSRSHRHTISSCAYSSGDCGNVIVAKRDSSDVKRSPARVPLGGKVVRAPAGTKWRRLATVSGTRISVKRHSVRGTRQRELRHPAGVQFPIPGGTCLRRWISENETSCERSCWDVT